MKRRGPPRTHTYDSDDEVNAALRRFRRARARESGRHTKAEWEAMKAAIPYCVRCLRADVALTKDHIVPVFAGGSDHIGNLQPLCVSCNSSKAWDTDDLRPRPLPLAWMPLDNRSGTSLQLEDMIACRLYHHLI